MFLFLLSRVAVCVHSLSQTHVNVKSRNHTVEFNYP